MYFVQRISRHDGQTTTALRGRHFDTFVEADDHKAGAARMNPAYYYRVREACECSRLDAPVAANPDSGYCTACETARGIPPTIELSDESRRAMRHVALRDLDRR